MTRFTGMILLMALLATGLALRHRSSQRAERLFAGEAQAQQRIDALAAGLARVEAGVLPSQWLARDAELQLLPDAGDETAAYARDSSYVYGLGLVSVVDRETGRPRPGWVLRAWPLEYGVTGDLEFHLDDRGVLWHGQNPIGRSGLTEGFPPDFPEKTLGKRGQPWWRPEKGAIQR